MEQMRDNRRHLAHRHLDHQLVIVLRKAMDDGRAAVSLAIALEDLAIWASSCGLREVEHLIGAAAIAAQDHATAAGQCPGGRRKEPCLNTSGGQH